MTKKYKHWHGRSKSSASVIKSVSKDTFAGAICPTNIEEQKERFLKFGRDPEFTHRGTEEELEEIYLKPRSEIRFGLLGEAIHILNTVSQMYGDAENIYKVMYGEKISKEEATDIVVSYLKENCLDGAMTIVWCTDLPCSGRMMWQGPHVKFQRPEDRKYSIWLKDANDNNFIREHGMRCLADHEIGTHFFRSYNDGLQPWYADRTRFGIRGLGSLEQLRTEEGLAAVNTVLNSKMRYLWGPALLYYIACKASDMSFKELFDHLATYVANPEWRWRHCVRVKRGLLNPNDIGGLGKDQCYFEGAVEILRNIDEIDFHVLMSGKVCIDEIKRVKRVARMDCIRFPAFMKNQDKYKKILKQIAAINGLNMNHPKYKAPAAYLRRLKRGRRIGVAGGTTNKVRGKGKKGHVKGGSRSESDDKLTTSEEDDKISQEDGQISASVSRTDCMQSDKIIKSDIAQTVNLRNFQSPQKTDSNPNSPVTSEMAKIGDGSPAFETKTSSLQQSGLKSRSSNGRDSKQSLSSRGSSPITASKGSIRTVTAHMSRYSLPATKTVILNKNNNISNQAGSESSRMITQSNATTEHCEHACKLPALLDNSKKLVTSESQTNLLGKEMNEVSHSTVIIVSENDSDILSSNSVLTTKTSDLFSGSLSSRVSSFTSPYVSNSSMPLTKSFSVQSVVESGPERFIYPDVLEFTPPSFGLEETRNSNDFNSCLKLNEELRPGSECHTFEFCSENAKPFHTEVKFQYRRVKSAFSRLPSINH
ncbi:hypothetical protein CHS0354_021536 [Potamilus streckersoni]|uniref:Uncharacterized protein n=1 Tax=Potamilus streckersoni TaxID=2493646 RepID=A0AAE0SNE4_9BIVA|nr:hypothetical protein CHS0354_021536 [Potamilus streckersoni]